MALYDLVVSVLAGSRVVLVRWPEEADELERLRALGIPRLLLIAPGEEPPVDADPKTDWLRTPIADDELRVRVRVLEARTNGSGDRPVLPGDGRLLFQGRWVALPPLSERLLEVLVDHFTDVVPLDELVRAAWSGSEDHRGTLRVNITKLRPNLEALGLAITAVRDRGYVLHLTDHGPERAE